MKWSLYFMLVLNVAFFFWQSNPGAEKRPAPSAPAEESRRGLKTILLLHEAERASKESKENANAQSSEAPKPRRVKEPARAPVQEETPPPPPAPPSVSTQLEAVPAPFDEVPEPSELELQVAAALRQPRAALPKPPLSPPKEVPSEERRACYSVGPYEVKMYAETARAKFETYKMSAQLRESEKKDTVQFWVLEATKDEAAAQQRLEQLNAKRVTDATIIAEGEHQHMISLGKYNADVEAKLRLGELNKLGFQPVIERHYSMKSAYWVDFEETARNALTPPRWQEVTSGLEGLVKEDRVCK